MVLKGDGSQPLVLPKYPHMMPEDYLLWRQFVANGSYLPDKVWYDVRVGRGWPVLDTDPEWKKKYIEASTKKRIDVVALYGNIYMVLEVKPDAGCEALGQVIYYAEDFSREHAGGRGVMAGIVTDVCDQDVRQVFDLAGIVVFEVGEEG